MLALVTGGNRGIGLAIAEALADGGYDLILVGRDEETLQKAKEDVEAKGRKAWAIRCDVSDREQIKHLAEEVSGIGKLDLLVNNAGVAYYKEFRDTTQKEIDEMLDVNLRGLIDCTRALLPHMGKGIIINISSDAGRYGFPNMAVYCATKFGVIGFTEALARELQDIRVFAICPGPTDTDMWEHLFPEEQAQFVPEDVAMEVMELLKDADRIEPGKAIGVRKHVGKA